MICRNQNVAERIIHALCELPYFREEELGGRLGEVLKNIHVSDQVLGPLQKAMVQDRGRAEEHKQREMERLNQRLEVIRHRIARAYLDKLDGKGQTTGNCSFELSSRCHKRLSHPQKAIRLDLRSSQNWGMVRPERFELPTPCFVGKCSIQLSYGRIDGLSVSYPSQFRTVSGGCQRGAERETYNWNLMPRTVSTSSMGTISMASHGQPSRKEPSGPLLVHFLHPMHSMGSTSIRPKGGLSSSITQYIQSSTGQ